MHNNHKIIDISDEESLKKQNITIEYSSKEFNKLINEILYLKENIENEINKINNLYEKTIEDVEKSFIKKHEALNKQENDIKEKLQNEVTKIKEQLENLLSQVYNEIKINERIKKGIDKLGKEEKNKFKTLTYISKLNKNKKSMNQLSQQIMKSMKFCYIEEKGSIDYEEYFFNGIGIPYNIEFNYISSNSLDIKWDFEHKDIYNNQLKFQVEMKEIDSDNNFKIIYEGDELNCRLNELYLWKIYEFRICAIYDKFKGKWSEIKKNNIQIDSIILNEEEKKKEYIDTILEWTESKSLELIYRGTKDGTRTEQFHHFCDNQGPTVTLFKNEKNNIFGGYASISWENNGGYKSAENSFIFTITNIHNTKPTKFISKNDGGEVYHDIIKGPWFGRGRDLGIDSDFSKSQSYTHFPYTYQDNLEKGRSIFTGNFNNDSQYYKIKEIEVFKIHK